MTETHSNSSPPLDTDACEVKAHEQARLSESIHAANKAALFDALARAGITRIAIEFDGSSDDGQITSVLTFAGDTKTELPTAEVQFLQAIFGNPEPQPYTLQIPDAVEALAYDFLEASHPGWEINDGATANSPST